MKKKSNFHFIVNTQPIQNMRYKTIGDWFEIKNLASNKYLTKTIISADTGNLDYNFLIALHELIEAYLCHKKGITTEQVDKWDKAHPDEEPGMMTNCPYRHEHFLATTIEATMAQTLNINWDKYDKAVNKTLKQYK